jgi:hypothetical protein
VTYMIFGWNNAIDSIAYNIFVSDFSLVPIVMLMATSINCYRASSAAMALIFGESNPSHRSKSLLPPRGSSPWALAM